MIQPRELHPYTGRERAVPCREVGCHRSTWRDDAFCDRHAPDPGETSPLSAPVGEDAPSRSARPRHPSVGSVATEPRTEDWWIYHQLVIDECRGEAPEGTAERLATDPFRWAAHLGCEVGEITEQLKAQEGDPEWRRRACGARRHLLARKADVVALRKRESLHVTNTLQQERIAGLVTALRQIAQIAASGTRQQVIELARTALDRPTTGEEGAGT